MGSGIICAVFNFDRLESETSRKVELPVALNLEKTPWLRFGTISDEIDELDLIRKVRMKSSGDDLNLGLLASLA